MSASPICIFDFSFTAASLSDSISNRVPHVSRLCCPRDGQVIIMKGKQPLQNAKFQWLLLPFPFLKGPMVLSSISCATKSHAVVLEVNRDFLHCPSIWYLSYLHHPFVHLDRVKCGALLVLGRELL
jgi:hypothetical protein